MARIPSIAEIGLGAGPSPAGGGAGYRGERPGAEALPAAFAAVGNDLLQAGNTQYSLYRAEQGHLAAEKARADAKFEAQFKEEQRKANAARAEDAFNQFRTKTLDLTAGEGGFMRLQGAQVATNPNLLKDYTQRAADAARLLSEGLDNDDQRQAFKQRADLGMYQYQHDLLNHITRENQVFGKELYKGTVDTELTQATAHYRDPVSVATSVERITSATNDYADAQGIPKSGPGSEARTALITDNVGKVHQSVIGQAIASNQYGYAKEWFEAYGHNMDPGVQANTRNLLRDGEQKEGYNNYTRLLTGNHDSLKGLRSLAKEIEADGSLDETRKNALLGRIESRTDSLERKAEMDAQRAERAIQSQITTVNAMIMAGYPPSAAQLAPLINASKGTALEPMARQMVATANEVERFQRMTPPDQEKYINQLDAAAHKDPAKFDITLVSRLKASQTAQQQAVRENPTGFAVRMGFVDPQSPAAQPLDFSKPDTPEFSAQLQAKFQLAKQMSQRYQVPVAPLGPADAALLAQATRGMQPEAKRDYFSRLAKAAGTDVTGYRAMMQQISPDDTVTAAGGMWAMYGVKNEKGQFVADSIFRGQSYLNPPSDKDGKAAKSQVVMPNGAEKERMDNVFDNLTGNAFEGKPQPRQMFLETARAIYADKTVARSDFTGNLNNTLWREAVQEALGGEPLRMNGRTVIPPPGMKGGDFKDQVRLRLDDIESSGQLPPGLNPGALRGLPLENIGDGRYTVTAGGQLVATADGKKIVLDFNQPWVPQGKGRVEGQLEQGNINLKNRPVVKNADGSISTVRSMSFNEDGKEVLVPTVVGGRVVSDREAIDHYRKTGEHLGKFKTPEAATAYAESLHRDQERMYVKPSTAGEAFRNTRRRQLTGEE